LSAIGGPIALSVGSKSLDKLIHLTALVPKQSPLALPPSPSPGLPNRKSFSFAAGSSALGISLPTPGEALDDSGQVAELERALRTVSTATGRVDSNTTALSKKYLIMRSRLPRKTAADSFSASSSSSGLSLLGGSSSTNKKSVHTLAFGKDTRVKSASRKNLVVDSVFSMPLTDEGDGAAAGVIGTEWTTDGDRPPILEVSLIDCLALCRAMIVHICFTAVQIGKMEEDIFAVDFFHLTPFQAFVIAIAAFDQ
jgi:hypothetical protein